MKRGEEQPSVTKKDWAVAAVLLGLLVGNALLVRLAFSAWREEREHAEFLYDCCHHQTPKECENDWLAQYASKPPPILVELLDGSGGGSK